MNSLFLISIVFPLSFTGSLAFLIWYFLQMMFRQTSSKLQKLSLLAVSLLFLIPVMALVPTSWLNPVNSKTTPVTTHNPAYTLGETLGETAAQGQNTTVPTSPSSKTITKHLPSPLQSFAIVYTAATLSLAIFHVSRNWRFQTHLSASLTIPSPSIQQQYWQAAQQLGIQTPPPLYLSSMATTPLLTGLLKPRIILPQASVSNALLGYALLHELTHYKNKDLWQKQLVLLAHILHWFNPLTYFICKKFGQLCENHCDDGVTQLLPANQRQSYAHSLLSFAYGSPPNSVGFSASGNRLKNRLTRIISPAKPKKKIQLFLTLFLGAGVVFSMLAGCSLSAGAQSSSSLVKSQPPSSSQPVPTVASSSNSVQSQPQSIPSSKDQSVSSPTSSETMVHPVPDSTFSSRGFGQGHRGRDYNAPEGTPIYAVLDGTVLTAEYHYSNGNYLVLQHENGLVTLYSHCETLLVKQGDTVSQGTQIATVGSTGMSTGPHCHFEVQTSSGELLNPDDYIPLTTA